ncbi:MAG: polyprenyl synthetase family protein [Peptococcaceae bacterium]|jgi:geranylgeranyl diphosphate synthase type II|nr:polyprenyl synthetase family protein [Peptococcaceae bacterium]
MEITTYFASVQQEIEETLARLLPVKNVPEARLYEAMSYSSLGGGKRLRPVLFCAVLDLLGVQEKKAFLPFAAAIEMIHCYSLIHDDLPAMDNDDYRRGRLTNHKVYGEAMAILAGDGLLTYAFQVMLGIRIPGVGAEQVLTATKQMADCAGLCGMVAGQAVDILNEGTPLTLEELRYIHRKKTGAMIKGAIVSAAILAGATKEEQEALAIYGEQIGLAFQIADDILDVIGDSKEIGKKAGSDDKNGKVTYPSLLGIEGAYAYGEEAISAAVGALHLWGEEADLLREIAYFCLQRKK